MLVKKKVKMLTPSAKQKQTNLVVRFDENN